MKKPVIVISSLLLLACSQSVFAALKIVACEPEWGALAEELGGGKVSVSSATTGRQDPHNIQARPSLIAKVRNADLLVCTGAQLEIGWLPILLRQSSNEKIQPGNSGYFEASSFVQKLEVPARMDRAEGDVHPDGNPHIQTDPHNIALVADALAERLAQVDPDNADFYKARHQAFSGRWQAAMKRWEAEATPLKGVTIVVHHKYWPYLNRWLGLREVAELEPKPGIEPTATHLAKVLDKLQREPAKMIIRTAYNDSRASESLAEHAKIPAVVLPGTVGGDDEAKDLFSLFDDTIQRLLAAVK